MLTKGDDYPLHQTPEPIMYAGHDRRFYERYFFNGYSRDFDVFFAMGMGIYPCANLIDASFCVTYQGVQHNLHASRVMDFERLDTWTGPIHLHIVEPLKVLRIVIDDNEHGIRGDLTFQARVDAIEEPRQILRQGARTIMDCTRLTQHGAYTGWLEIKGQRIEVRPDRFLGTRDRSWGVRSVGAQDAQPVLPAMDFQTYFLWAQLNFDDLGVCYGTFEDAQGKPWHSHGVMAPVGGGAITTMVSGRCLPRFKPGTRHAQDAVLEMTREDGAKVEITLEFQPMQFYMRGLGYFHQEWGHGMYKGPSAVGYEAFEHDKIDEALFEYNHVETCCKARMVDSTGKVREGVGIMEQLILGPHVPSGFKEFMDGAV